MSFFRALFGGSAKPKERRVLAIYKSGIAEYHVSVEFGDGTRQQYRGMYGWVLYPQGTRLDSLDNLNEWLNAYVQQFEWSQEQ